MEVSFSIISLYYKAIIYYFIYFKFSVWYTFVEHKVFSFVVEISRYDKTDRYAKSSELWSYRVIVSSS